MEFKRLQLQYFLSIKPLQKFINELNVICDNVKKKNNTIINLVTLTHANKKNKGCQININFVYCEDIDINKVYNSIDDVIIQIEKLSFSKNLVLLKNDANNNFCIELYTHVLKIETGLRTILKKFEISLYGYEWSDKLFENFKGKRQKKELNELTLSELKELMFDVKSYPMKFEEGELEKKKKVELIQIILSYKTISFWEYFFKDIDIENTLNEAIVLRNKVMHFKTIKYKDYKQQLQKCKNLINKISEAENSMVLHNFAELITLTMQSFYEAVKSFPLFSVIKNIITKETQ